MALGIPKDAAGQKRMVLGALPLLAAFAYYQFYHSGQAVLIAEKEDRYEALAAINDQNRPKADPAAIQQTRQKLDLWLEHLKQLEALVPLREEVPALLRGLTERASAVGIDFAGITPEGEVPTEFYTKQTYTVRVVGSYHAIGRYLAMIGSLPRVVTPTEVRVSAPANINQNRREGTPPRLQMDFKIHTYVIPPPETLPGAAPPVTGLPNG